jgi:beta-lactamase regulating signal transducer with metallopeptidase domain
MNTSFWTPYISDGAVKAICWTLIHSLWIGLIIALITGLVITLTRKSGSDLRYRLLCGILVLFVFSVSFTYYLEIKSVGVGSSPAYPKGIVISQINIVSVSHADAMPHLSMVTRVVTLLNQNINIIFVVWLMFFMLKSLKMASGLLYIQRIRNYKVHKVEEEFKHKIEMFSSQIGIRQTVRLVQSELVKVPVAVGWLKPVILLPMGVILQLSTEQLESILWHELAHIRRRDYLVNILQGLVETVFFFNPGLLWLSSLIRAEREACCDDMVLSRMNRKANYLEALLSFGYGEFKQANFAMSIGSGNQLRARLKRIINQENRRLGVIEKVVLVTGIIVLSAFAGLTKANKKYIGHLTNSGIEKAASKSIANNFLKQGKALLVIKDSKMTDTPYNQIDSLVHLSSSSYKKGDYSPVTMVDITAEDIHGKEYHLTLADNRLVAFEINGRKVKDSELGKYQPMVNIFKEREKAYGTVLVNKLKAGETATPAPAGSSPLQQLQQSTPPSTALNHETDTLSLAHVSMSSYRNVADNISTDKVTAEDNHGKNYYFIITNEKVTFMDIDGEKIKDSDLPKYQYMVTLVRENQRAHNPQLNKNKPPRPDKPQEPTPPTPPPSLDKMIADVTNDLVNEHIIKDKSSLSTVKLTYAELVVNGVKQPDEVQKKFAAKYYPGNARLSKDPNYGLWYNARTHGVALGTFNIDLDAL